MELKDFIKTKKNQKFLKTTYSHSIYTKSNILAEIQEKIEQWLAVGETQADIKDRAVSFVLQDFEPMTMDLRKETKKLMTKWGLVN